MAQLTTAAWILFVINGLFFYGGLALCLWIAFKSKSKYSDES